MKLIRQFNVGDHVKWASQAAGSWVVKVGKVVEVVPAGKRPTKYRTIATRKYESYVVMATTVKRGRGPGPSDTLTAYWPVATALRPWSGSTTPSAMRVSR